MKLSRLMKGGLLVAGAAAAFWVGLVFPTAQARADEVAQCTEQGSWTDEEGGSCSETCCAYIDESVGVIVDTACGEVCVYEGD